MLSLLTVGVGSGLEAARVTQTRQTETGYTEKRLVEEKQIKKLIKDSGQLLENFRQEILFNPRPTVERQKEIKSKLSALEEQVIKIQNHLKTHRQSRSPETLAGLDNLLSDIKEIKKQISSLVKPIA